MSATQTHDLLRELSRAGVVVTAAGDRLHYRSETGQPIPAALIARLRDHKAELLAILAGKCPQRGHCWTCGVRLPLEPWLLYAQCAECAVAALGRLRGRGGGA